MLQLLIKIVFFIRNPYAPFLFKGIKNEALSVFSRYILNNVRTLIFFCFNVKFKNSFFILFYI